MATDNSGVQPYVDLSGAKTSYNYSTYNSSANISPPGSTTDLLSSYGIVPQVARLNYPVISYDYVYPAMYATGVTIDTKNTDMQKYYTHSYLPTQPLPLNHINPINPITNSNLATTPQRRITAREEDLELILNRWNLKLSDLDPSLLDRFIKMIYRCVPTVLSDLDNLRLDVSNINSRFYQCLNDAEDLYYNDFHRYDRRPRRSRSRSRSRSHNRSRSRKIAVRKSRSPSPPSQPYVPGPNTLDDPRFEKLKPPVRTTLEGYIAQGLFDLSTLDDRALTALSEMGTSSGLVIIKKFSEAKVETLRNASSYFMNIIKRYTEGTLRH